MQKFKGVDDKKIYCVFLMDEYTKEEALSSAKSFLHDGDRGLSIEMGCHTDDGDLIIDVPEDEADCWCIARIRYTHVK